MNANGSTKGKEPNEAEETMQTLFPFICLVFMLILDNVSTFVSKITPIKVSVTIYIIFFSFLATIVVYLAMGDTAAEALLDRCTWVDHDPHKIMFVILPIVVFEGAFKIDSHAFKHHLVTILFLAVPCFAAATVLTGVGMKWVEQDIRGDEEWTLEICLLFGTMISATDPVAVLSLLHEVGAPHDLTLIIEGESLLNDGVAIVMYNVFKAVARSKKLGDPTLLTDEIKHLAIGITLTIVIGYVMSLICGYWLTFTSHETIKERSIIIATVYITYMVCEASKGSGVVGLVVLGVNLDQHKEKISEDGTRDNIQTWEFLAYWANAIVFTITGITCGKFIWGHRSTAIDFVYMVAVYGNIMMVRFLVLLPTFLTCYHVHRLPFRYIVMLWWGGLRGAVAILLAMQLQKESFLGPNNKRRAQEYIALCVFLSLSFQAMFAPKVVSKLKLDKVSKYRQRIMAEVTKRLRNGVLQKIDDWYATVPYFREVHWPGYLQKVYITNPYDSHDVIKLAIHEKRKSRMILPSSDSYKDDTTKTDTAELCHRVLVLATSCFEKLKKQGVLTNAAYLRISHALRQADDLRKFNIETAANHWRPHSAVANLNQCLQGMYGRFNNYLNSSGKSLRQWIFDDSIGKGVIWVIYEIGTPFISVLHVLFIHWSMAEKCDENNSYEENREIYRRLLAFEFAKSMCIVLLVTSFCVSIGREVILRPDTISRKLASFWKMSGRLWHVIDLFCMFPAFAFIFLRLRIMETCYQIQPGDEPDLPCHLASQHCVYTLQCEYIFGIRLLRLLTCVYHIVLLAVLAVEWWVGETIAILMECLHGMVKGLERFEDMLEKSHLFEHKEDLHKFKVEVFEKADQQRSLAGYLLAVLQAEYPSICIRVKTQTMGIVSLKEMHEKVSEEKRDGVLEPEEAAALQAVIRKKVIKVLSMTRGATSLDLETSLTFNPSVGSKADFLIQRCKPVRRLVEAGDRLYEEDKHPSTAFYLLSGSLALERKTSPNQYRMIHPGQFVGEISSYFNCKRRGTMTAVTPCEVCAVTRILIPWTHGNQIHSTACKYVGDEDSRFCSLAAAAVYAFERAPFVKAVDKRHFDSSPIWILMLSQYCFAKATPYLQKLAKYRDHSKQQIYRMMRAEWEVLNLTYVAEAHNTSGYSTMIWIDGKAIDDDRHELIHVKNVDQPFEITARSVRNAEVDTPLLFAVCKKGATTIDEEKSQAEPFPLLDGTKDIKERERVQSASLTNTLEFSGNLSTVVGRRSSTLQASTWEEPPAENLLPRKKGSKPSRPEPVESNRNALRRESGDLNEINGSKREKPRSVRFESNNTQKDIQPGKRLSNSEAKKGHFMKTKQKHIKKEKQHGKTEEKLQGTSEANQHLAKGKHQEAKLRGQLEGNVQQHMDRKQQGDSGEKKPADLERESEGKLEGKQRNHSEGKQHSHLHGKQGRQDEKQGHLEQKQRRNPEPPSDSSPQEVKLPSANH